MPVVSIGDMSQHFISLRNGGSLKAELARHGQELVTGRLSDVVAGVGGDTRQLSGLEHSLNTNASYQNAAQETSLLLEQMQLSLERVEDARSSATDSLLLISSQSLPNQISEAVQTSQQSFGEVVTALNGQLANRSLFSGTSVDVVPLATADDMLADIRQTVGGATTASDIAAIVDDWFDSPTGGFQTMGYQAENNGSNLKFLGPEQTINIETRADDERLKDILKATSKAAILADLTQVIPQVEQAQLLQMAGAGLLSGASGLTEVRAELGNQQNRVSVITARLSAEESTLSIAFNDMTAADPFETASKLQAVQAQLETHFAVTARLSRLTLAEYI